MASEERAQARLALTTLKAVGVHGRELLLHEGELAAKLEVIPFVELVVKKAVIHVL